MEHQPENDQVVSPPVIITDLVFVDEAFVVVTLTNDGELKSYGNKRRQLTIKKDVLGFIVEGKQIRVKAVVEKDVGICCRNDFIFEPLSDDARARWCFVLRQYLDSLGRPKRLLVFVNPFGGKKSARKIFEKEVKPWLEAADIQIEVQETKYQLHAKEFVRSMEISKYDGIVCVSGDGVLVEVVNGLLERADWRHAIKLPIGMVPAGTGNGMIKSLLDSGGLRCCANAATLSIIRGHKRVVDVATISQGTTKFFSVLMLAWGLIADIDIESEKFRWMGSARIDIYALLRIICLRQYNGRVLFIPAPGFESYGQPASSSIYKEPHVNDKVLGYQGPDTKLEDLEWREIKGPFVSIWLHNVPWGAENTLAAPDAKFSDGFLDLIVLRNCSKLVLLSLMTQLNDGTHVKSPYISYLKVKAFVLEPGALVDDPDKEGIIDSDGEVLARGKRTYNCEQKALMSYDKLQITIDQVFRRQRISLQLTSDMTETDWDDGIHENVKKIRITRYNIGINSVEFTYLDGTETVTVETHGNPSTFFHSITLIEREYITEIEVDFANILIYSLRAVIKFKFTTNNGCKWTIEFADFNYTDRETIKYAKPDNKIVGFFGTFKDGFLNHIGVHFAPINNT